MFRLRKEIERLNEEIEELKNEIKELNKCNSTQRTNNRPKPKTGTELVLR